MKAFLREFALLVPVIVIADIVAALTLKAAHLN